MGKAEDKVDRGKTGELHVVRFVLVKVGRKRYSVLETIGRQRKRVCK